MITELKDVAKTFGKKPRTANSFVADTLRRAIVSGVLKAGMPLRQEELAEALGVSRIPVREALRQLEAEGLIIFEAHKGATVGELSAADFDEMTEMRIALEVLALRLSVPNLTDNDIRECEATLDDMDQEMEQQKDLQRLCTLHIRFHLALYGRANRPRLMGTIEGLHQKVERYVRFQVGQLDYAKHGQAEHRQLLRACARHDVAEACSFLEKHIRSAADDLLRALAKMGNES
jgi:DNA-binding GntR family transcriptional regulator